MAKSEEFKELLQKGKEQGYLTKNEVDDHLPEVIDSEQVEDIYGRLSELGIIICDTVPDTGILLPRIDETAADEIANLPFDSELFARTTDPVRMYMREMGGVDLLTRQGEIAIAKRIEEGLKGILTAFSQYPAIIELVLSQYDKVESGEKRLTDIITGFIDEEIDESQIVETDTDISDDAEFPDIEGETE